MIEIISYNQRASLPTKISNNFDRDLGKYNSLKMNNKQNCFIRMNSYHTFEKPNLMIKSIKKMENVKTFDKIEQARSIKSEQSTESSNKLKKLSSNLNELEPYNTMETDLNFIMSNEKRYQRLKVN